MAALPPSARSRADLNFTETSTLRLLLGATLTCALLWFVIAATVGA